MTTTMVHDGVDGVGSSDGSSVVMAIAMIMVTIIMLVVSMTVVHMVLMVRSGDNSGTDDECDGGDDDFHEFGNDEGVMMIIMVVRNESRQ